MSSFNIKRLHDEPSYLFTITDSPKGSIRYFCLTNWPILSAYLGLCNSNCEALGPKSAQSPSDLNFTWFLKSPLLTFYHFDEDRVTVPLPRLSDEATHAATVVFRGPFETLTSVHFSAVQCTAHTRRGHRWWQLGKTLSFKSFFVSFSSRLVVYCLYFSSFFSC